MPAHRATVQPDPSISKAIWAIVDVLREERETRQISKKWLAQESGVTRTAIILMERHERSPSLELVLRLSRGLGLSFGEVVARAVAEKEF